MSSARSVDVRFLQHPLACSWRSLSTCDTTTAVALSLYIQESAPHELKFRLSLLVVFSFALRVSFDTRFVSAAPASAFDSAGASRLHLVSTGSFALLSCLPTFCSRLYRRSPLCSRLFSRLCPASDSSLPRLRLSLIACEYNICFSPVANRIV